MEGEELHGKGEEHHNLTQDSPPSVGCISSSQDAITNLGASHLLENVTKSREYLILYLASLLLYDASTSQDAITKLGTFHLLQGYKVNYNTHQNNL